MKHLNRSILADYDVPANAPDRLCCVQFGDDALLLGLVDRLLDDANQRGANIGVAVVQPGETGFAASLAEQDGLFTTFVRGDLDEKDVHREQVVQSVLRALDPPAVGVAGHEPRDMAHQGRFSGTGRADERDHFAGLDVQADPVKPLPA
mgnify:CR=1 FL=1